MSHSHTHAPGESHSHSHSHAPQQPQVVTPQPDPLLQAAIDQTFKSVNLKLDPQNDAQTQCASHGLEKCTDCDLDFMSLNQLAKILAANPQLPYPPPPQAVQPQRSQAVNKTKEDGNTLFKAQKHAQAVSMYTVAANVAAQRLPWESNVIMREELSMVLSNRSAAYVAANDYVGGLVDADAVIQLKKPWSKGHFRKAKALVELGQLQEAKDAVKLGLQFEPTNAEMNSFLEEINTKLKQETKPKSSS